MNFYEDTLSIPKTIAIGFWDNQQKAHRSKQTDINLMVKDSDFREIIERKVYELIKAVEKVIFPCGSLSITIRNFVKSDFKTFAYDLKTYSKKLLEKEKSESDKVLDALKPIVSTSELGKKCQICGEFFEINKFDTHLDYHLACDIDKEMNPKKRKYQVDKKQSQLSESILAPTKMIKREVIGKNSLDSSNVSAPNAISSKNKQNKSESGRRNTLFNYFINK